MTNKVYAVVTHEGIFKDCLTREAANKCAFSMVKEGEYDQVFVVQMLRRVERKTEVLELDL